MPLAALLSTVTLFALGQAAAIYNLRTGRFWPGALVTGLLWVAADAALLQRFVYGELGGWFEACVGVVWGTGAGAAGWLGFELWRRRRSATARARTARFRIGLVAYLRGDLPAAAAVFVQLVRCDPWDTAAWCALANVRARAGQPRRARACRARARAVDRGAYRLWLQQALPGVNVRQGAMASAVAAAARPRPALRAGA
jgi:hypothetical protein